MRNPWEYKSYGETVATCDAPSRIERIKKMTREKVEAVLAWHDNQKVVIAAAQRRLKEIERAENTPLNAEQIAIMEHPVHRAANGCYCGDSPDMQGLVNAGLMRSVGKASYCPDEYFRLTEKGKARLAQITDNDQAQFRDGRA